MAHGRNERRSSSSSDDESDEGELKDDAHIPDDERYFVFSDTAEKVSTQPNNMMDIFRRQPVESANRSSTPEHENRPMNNDDEGDDLALQDNFSFLIAKGMLKPSSSSSS